MTAGLHRPGGAWLALALLLAAASLLAWGQPPGRLDWQPGRWLDEPWRNWTAAFVHWTALHLGVNALGCLLVGALGAAAALPPRAALAWVLAWPLVHLGLLIEPGLRHYGGLSGLLHAGVAVVGCWLAVRAQGRRRMIALALLLGLAVKLVAEAAGGLALVQPPGWDFAVAPLAHATGAVAGAALGLVVSALEVPAVPAAGTTAGPR